MRYTEKCINIVRFRRKAEERAEAVGIADENNDPGTVITEIFGTWLIQQNSMIIITASLW